MLCGLEKYGVAIVAVLLLLFELVLMEGIIVTDFIAVVPRTATWLDFFTADVPVTPRVATALVYLVFWLLLLGFCFHKLSEQSYFRQLGGGRILLRSLAANYEAQSYSYCNMIFWTILFEFDTVIIPAYFPFVLALLVMETYEGNIREAAVLLLIFYLVSRLHSMAIYIVELLACIPEWLIQPEDGADGFSASATRPPPCPPDRLRDTSRLLPLAPPLAASAPSAPTHLPTPLASRARRQAGRAPTHTCAARGWTWSSTRSTTSTCGRRGSASSSCSS